MCVVQYVLSDLHVHRRRRVHHRRHSHRRHRLLKFKEIVSRDGYYSTFKSAVVMMM
jgi:hypothetical protein